MDHVAEAAFVADQQRLALERLAGPARRIDFRVQRALPGAPFVVLPAFLKATLAQAKIGEIDVRLGVAWIEAHAHAAAALGVFETPHLRE